MTRDPVRGGADRPVSLNSYLYADARPTVVTDPSGACPFCIVAVLVGIEIGSTVGDAIFMAEDLLNPHLSAEEKGLSVLVLAASLAGPGGGHSLALRAGREASEAAKRHTPHQEALMELAKSAERTGVTRQEAEVLVEWAEEYGLKYHGPMAHLHRNFKDLHVKIGSERHIRILE